MITAIEIPHLEAGQKIAKYKKIYKAATATFTADQQLACLPVYIHRSEGEKNLAHTAATKKSVDQAFKFLEEIIDGKVCVISECEKFFYGIPKSLQSDQGQNVDGRAMRKMCEELAIKKLRSSAYHPAGNGSAERAIQSLKTLLRSMCSSRNISIHQWDQLLPEAVLHLNNTANASSKFSPFEMAYGMPANTVLDNKMGVDGSFKTVDKDLVRLNAISNKRDASHAYREQANKATKVHEYDVGDLVLLRRTHGDHPKMNPFWVGPYQIEKKVGPVNWGIVDLSSGKSKIVHHDLIKPAGKEANAKIIPPKKQCTEEPTKVSKIHVVPQKTSSCIQPGPQINREQFTSNVFSHPGNVSAPPVSASVGSVSKSRHGRVIKAPNRLGINDFY